MQIKYHLTNLYLNTKDRITRVGQYTIKVIYTVVIGYMTVLLMKDLI